MKILSRILSLLVIASLGLFYAGCGGGSNTPDPAEKTQLGKLSTTWKISAVTLDGTNRIADFTNFTLTLSGTFNTSTPKGPYQYSVAGSRPSPNPWPASGTWTFGADITRDFVRNDSGGDLSMTYALTDTQLAITIPSYTGTGFAGGKASQVNGTWIFTFTK